MEKGRGGEGLGLRSAGLLEGLSFVMELTSTYSYFGCEYAEYTERNLIYYGGLVVYLMISRLAHIFG